MTMDIHQHSLRVDTSNINGQKTMDQFSQNLSPQSPRSPPSATSPKNSYTSSSVSPFPLERPKAKRSFDVAFLIQPDDLSKKRQQKLKQTTQAQVPLNLNSTQQHQGSPKINGFPVSDAHLSNLLLQNSYLYEQRHMNSLAKLEDRPPYNLVMSERSPFNLDSLNVIGSKSAFTKVTQPPRGQDKIEEKHFTSSSRSPSISSQISGGGGMSPDHSYQDSLSPPGIARSPVPFSRQKLPVEFHQTSMGSPNLPHFNTDKINGGNGGNYDLNMVTQREKSVERSRKNMYPDPKSGLIHVNVTDANLVNLSDKVSPKVFSSPKMRMGVPENVPYPGEPFPYPGLSVPNYPFPQMTSFPRQSMPMPLLAAATANVALLPSSFAALTLPAQNVCAKCKVSFRMTSDLVYHMRSHHKRETTVSDTLRKRREEKLKCPVCNESFRERHHLTRHMTAHQDKESDRGDLEDQEISEITSRASKKQISEKLSISLPPAQALPGK